MFHVLYPLILLILCMMDGVNYYTKIHRQFYKMIFLIKRLNKMPLFQNYCPCGTCIFSIFYSLSPPSHSLSFTSAFTYQCSLDLCNVCVKWLIRAQLKIMKMYYSVQINARCTPVMTTSKYSLDLCIFVVAHM